MERMEKIMEKIKKIALYTVGIISAVAAVTMLIAISAVDSESNVPIITVVVCLAWFVLVYVGLKIGAYIEEKQMENTYIKTYNKCHILSGGSYEKVISSSKGL